MKYTQTLLAVSFALLISVASPPGTIAQVKSDRTQPTAGDRGWPRKFAIGGSAFAIYQPQVEEWVGNQFSARAAFAVTEGQGKQPAYGVLWFNARTEIDKVNRLVTFSDFRVARMNFPSAPNRVAAYQSALQARAGEKDEVIALDRLLTDMAANQAASPSAGYEVRNDPPQIFFSTRPAILVLVDGNPELRPVQNTKLDRVINTRVLILHDKSSRQFYLHLMDGWLEAASIMGPWGLAHERPSDLQKALEAAAAAKQVDLLNGATADPKEAPLVHCALTEVIFSMLNPRISRQANIL